MKILVTGAQGQIGKALTQQLKDRRTDFLALSHSQLDITNKAEIQKIVSKVRPNLIINTAAYTSVDDAELNPHIAYSVNSQGAHNLAEIVASTGGAVFHLSTDYVFSGTQSQDYSEMDSPSPVNIYGKSKLDGEMAIATTPKHIILRTAWVFSENSNNFIQRLLHLGHRQPQLNIVCDQTGNPTYAGDIATALLKIADIYKVHGDLNWGVYHYAGQPSVSRFELASYLFNQAKQFGLYGHNPTPKLNSVQTINYPSSAQRPLNTSLCCTKIQREFGIMPSYWQTALDQLLSRLVTHDCK